MRLRRWEAETMRHGEVVSTRRRVTRRGAMGYYRLAKERDVLWMRTLAVEVGGGEAYRSACRRVDGLRVRVTNLATGESETLRPSA